MSLDLYSQLSENEKLAFDELKEKRFKNPETGKYIKIASALTYDKNTEPYKIALEYLKMYGASVDSVATQDTKSTTDTKEKEKRKVKLLNVRPLFFNFNKSKNIILISTDLSKDAPFIVFDESDGISDLTLFINEKPSDKQKIRTTTHAFYSVGDIYDLQVTRNNITHDNLQKFLTATQRIFKSKIRKFGKSLDTWDNSDMAEDTYKKLKSIVNL